MEVIEYFADVRLDFVHLWPYGQGGCTCKKCMPWGVNGFLKISETLSYEIRKRCPDTEIILSTWRFDCFVRGEWEKFSKYLDGQSIFFDKLMVELESKYVPEEIYHKAKKKGVDVIGFPEISMLTAVPWGGFGGVPVPDFFEKNYEATKNYHHGGIAYSEGIFEDINKVMVLSMYFGGESADEILNDYFSFYFSDDTVELCTELVRCLESTLGRSRINDKGMVEDYPTDDIVEYTPVFKIRNTGNIDRAYELACRIKDMLPGTKAESFRFRMLYLRTVIDKALNENGGKVSDITEEAARELEKIYYAQNADYAVCPITHRAIRENRGHI